MARPERTRGNAPARNVRRDEEKRGVTVTHRHRGRIVSEEDEEESEPVRIEGDVARVGVGGSITENTGDYNSVQVRVWIERPCRDDDRELERTYKKISDKVDDWLGRELDRAIK